MSSVNTNYNAANVSVGTPDPVGNSGSRSVGGNSSGVTGAEAAARAFVHAHNIGHYFRDSASIHADRTSISTKLFRYHFIRTSTLR